MSQSGSAMLTGIVILGASLLGFPGQAQSLGLEQQLRSQYPVTGVGADGVLVQAGAVLRVLKDGIRSMPASYAVFWPNNYRKGGRVGYHWSCLACSFRVMRVLQVGERVYLTDFEIKEAVVVFRFQSCGKCGPSDSGEEHTPYSAEMSFQLGKGYLAKSTLKEVQDTIGEMFEIVPPQRLTVLRPLGSSGTEVKAHPLATPNPQSASVPGSVYVNSQNGADRLQLNSDASFLLQEGGQSFNGTYSINGLTLKLRIVQLLKDVDIEIHDEQLIVNGEEIWIQPRR